MPLAYRHFNIADFQISLTKGTGIYQYGVELQIEDNIIKYLLSKIKQLRLMSVQLGAYYEEAAKPCNYNSFTESFFPHYIERIFEIYPDSSFWRSPVDILIEINKIFNFETYPTQSDLRDLAENLLYKLNPFTASPDSILEVIRYTDLLLTLLEPKFLFSYKI